jgi:hypothetical protein
MIADSEVLNDSEVSQIVLKIDFVRVIGATPFLVESTRRVGGDCVVIGLSRTALTHLASSLRRVSRLWRRRVSVAHSVARAGVQTPLTAGHKPIGTPSKEVDPNERV